MSDPQYPAGEAAPAETAQAAAAPERTGSPESVKALLRGLRFIVDLIWQSIFAWRPRWPLGLATLFQAHRLLQMQADERDEEIARLRDEVAAYRDLVLMLRSVPPLSSVSPLKVERKGSGAPPRPALSARPTMADINKKNRLRMMEEAEQRAGGGSPEERAEHRRRMTAQADDYAQKNIPGPPTQPKD
jgi:hypothetical protein